jgi:hypothetical protein
MHWANRVTIDSPASWRPKTTSELRKRRARNEGASSLLAGCVLGDIGSHARHFRRVHRACARYVCRYGCVDKYTRCMPNAKLQPSQSRFSSLLVYIFGPSLAYIIYTTFGRSYWSMELVIRNWIQFLWILLLVVHGIDI